MDPGPPARPNDRRRGMIWALASAAGAALMVVPWKLANEAGDPAHSVLVLLTVAALGSSTLGLGQRIRDEARPLRMGRMELGVASVLAIFTLLGNFASARAIQDISPALLNVLLRADVIFVAIFGWALLGERVERTFWLGAAVAMAGLIVLQGPIADDGLWALLSSGTGMAVVAAACFSGLAVVTRRFIHRIDPVAVNAIRLWIAVGIWFLFNPIPDLSRIPHEQIIYSAMAAIAGPFLGRLALMISSRYLEARMTTLAMLSTPVMTLFLAFVWIADWPAPYELLGGAIMMVGIAIPILHAHTTANSKQLKESA